VRRISLIALAVLVLYRAEPRAAGINFSCRVDHAPHLEIVGTNRGPPEYCKWVCWFKLLDNPYIGFVKSDGYERLSGVRTWRKTGDDSIDWTTINWRCRNRRPATR
jgi:hypothetical protein